MLENKIICYKNVDELCSEIKNNNSDFEIVFYKSNILLFVRISRWVD